MALCLGAVRLEQNNGAGHSCALAEMCFVFPRESQALCKACQTSLTYM